MGTQPSSSGQLNEAALTKLRSRLVGFAGSQGHSQDAEDLAHDALKVLQERFPVLDSLEDAVRLGNQILINSIRNKRRKKAGDQLPCQIWDTFASGSPTPEQETEEKEISGRLVDAISSAGTNCRRVLQLQLEGLTDKEIAEHLRQSTAWVQDTRFKCLKRIRKTWDGHR